LVAGGEWGRAWSGRRRSAHRETAPNRRATARPRRAHRQPRVSGTSHTATAAQIADDRPVKLTVELSAALHRDLVAYGQVLARETGQGAVEPAKLVGPMLARFMATDRAFAKLRQLL
jgi:hypothetical protein